MFDAPYLFRLLIVESKLSLLAAVYDGRTKLTQEYKTLLLTLSVLPLIIEVKLAFHTLSHQQSPYTWNLCQFRFFLFISQVDKTYSKIKLAWGIFQLHILHLHLIPLLYCIQIQLIGLLVIFAQENSFFFAVGYHLLQAGKQRQCRILDKYVLCFCLLFEFCCNHAAIITTI